MLENLSETSGGDNPGTRRQPDDKLLVKTSQSVFCFGRVRKVRRLFGLP